MARKNSRHQNALLERFTRSLVAAQRAPRTIKTYVEIAARFLRCIRARDPQRRDVDAFLADPLEGHTPPAPSSRNQALAAVRALAAFALAERTWSSDPTDGIRSLRLQPRDKVMLFSAQVRRLFREAPKVSFDGEAARDLAILALEYGLGLRVNEVHRLNVDQVDLANEHLLAVKRKGGRVQNMRLGKRLVALLGAHLDQRRGIAPDEPALFLSRANRRASVRTIQRLTERLRSHLGVPALTTHAARHSFVSNALAEGADLLAVSRVAGHVNLQTTQNYAHAADPLQRRVPAIAESAMIPLDALPKAAAKAVRQQQSTGATCPKCGCNRIHLGALDELLRERKPLDTDQALDDAA
jgi:integrase/recombinase XerD